MGGTYTQQGDYFLLDLQLPPEEERPTGQLRSHLADVEEQANALFLRLVKDYAASEGVTEQLKVEDPME